jgi:formate dehydrogenase
MGAHGSLAFWLQETINCVSGNLDRPGGTLVGQGVIDFAAFGKKSGTLMRSDRSRVGDYPSVNDGFPGGLLADEILTPGDRQVRALFVTGGNPLITMPNAGRLRRALQDLELLVTLDLFRNETGSVAHYVLPCTSPLERPDLPFVFPLLLGLQRRPYLQATRALVPPPGEVRDEASIYLDLCAESGVPLFGSRVAQAVLRTLSAAASLLGRRPGLPQELLLSLLLRVTGQGSFRRLLREPHGRLRPGHATGNFLEARIVTDDRRVQLSTPALLEAAGGLEGAFEAERAAAGRLKLITKRDVKTHNSWTHNLEAFASPGTNHLYVHPDDAGRLGLSEGSLADVSSDVATVRVPVRLLPDLMPGTVALPHGWGHQHATGLSVASRTRGVNVNLLAADGPGRLERLSGMAHLTGIPVDVRPAAGPADPGNWSGIPNGGGITTR